MHFFYLAQFILMVAGPIVSFVLRFIGFGVVSYVGIGLLIKQAKDQIIAQTGSLTPALLNIMGLLKIDMAINIILAAVTTRFILSGMDKLTGRKTTTAWRAPGKSGGSIEA